MTEHAISSETDIGANGMKRDAYGPADLDVAPPTPTPVHQTVNGHYAPDPHALIGLPRATTVRPRLARALPGLTAVFDAVMLLAANMLYFAGNPNAIEPSLLAAFDIVALLLIGRRRAYASRLTLDLLDDLRNVVAATAVATLIVVFTDALFSGSEPSAYSALQLWLSATAFLSIGRLLSNQLISLIRLRYGAPTVVVGAGRVGRLTAERLLDHPQLGLRPIAFLDAEPLDIAGKPLPLPVFSTNGGLARLASTTPVECAVVTFSTDSHDETLELLDECDRLGIRPLVVPRLFERVPSRLEVTHVGGLPLFEMYPTSPRSFQFAVKYALDRVIAALLLAVLAPFLFLIASVVALSVGRPILYRQHRVSLDGREFEMLKFRTMRTAPEDDDARLFDPDVAPGGVEGADRRTTVGTFLRRWSLDELPQLLNVVKGEMSLVGPRPERPEYVEYFRANVRRYGARLRTKAGITGWAQVHRLRGKTSITDRVEWDNYYIENFSLWLDLKILLRTIPEALKGRAD